MSLTWDDYCCVGAQRPDSGDIMQMYVDLVALAGAQRTSVSWNRKRGRGEGEKGVSVLKGSRRWVWEGQ